MVDPSCEVDYQEGCVLQDADGIFVSMKLPWVDRLPKATHDVLLKLALKWGEMVAHVPRGGRKASVSRKFYCGGLKGDTDSGLAMFQTPLNGVGFDSFFNNQSAIRNVLRREIMPRVEKYLYTAVDMPRDALRGRACAAASSLTFLPLLVVIYFGMSCMKTLMFGSSS